MRPYIPASFTTALASLQALFAGDLSDYLKVLLSATLTFCSAVAVKLLEHYLAGRKAAKKADDKPL